MTIHEPMTFATDLILAGATLYWGGKLWTSGRRTDVTARRWWGVGFIASGLSALSGGIYHGLGVQAGELLRFVLWKGTVYGIGVAGLGLLLGAVGAIHPRLRRWFVLFGVGKFVVYSVWMSTHNEFRFVVYDYAPTLLIILALQLCLWLHTRKQSSVMIGGGIVLSFVAAAIQLLKIAPHPHFNHNDLYHLIQLLAFWLLYRGGMNLEDFIPPQRSLQHRH